MNNSNYEVLFGRLGADPELKYTRKQEPVCYFSIAENKEGMEKPVWHKIAVWGKQGEDCKLYLKKGLPVFVRGQKIKKEYESKEGLKVYHEFKADVVGIVTPRPESFYE